LAVTSEAMLMPSSSAMSEGPDLAWRAANSPMTFALFPRGTQRSTSATGS
jgi:hypothetical protein